jgi:hypothetical protein
LVELKSRGKVCLCWVSILAVAKDVVEIWYRRELSSLTSRLLGTFLDSLLCRWSWSIYHPFISLLILVARAICTRRWSSTTVTRWVLVVDRKAIVFNV